MTARLGVEVSSARTTKEVPARENTSRGECAGRRIAFGERPPGERLLCYLSEATPWGAVRDKMQRKKRV